MLIFLSLNDIGFLGLMLSRGLAFEGQDPQGPLKHLQLIPDSAERDFGALQLNCSPLVIVFKVFFVTCSFHFTGLESAIDLLLYKSRETKSFVL
jgi:hypothetical protein